MIPLHCRTCCKRNACIVFLACFCCWVWPYHRSSAGRSCRYRHSNLERNKGSFHKINLAKVCKKWPWLWLWWSDLGGVVMPKLSEWERSTSFLFQSFFSSLPSFCFLSFPFIIFFVLHYSLVFLPLPVRSPLGPVYLLRVSPLCLVQLNESSLSLVHLQKSFSKSQSAEGLNIQTFPSGLFAPLRFLFAQSVLAAPVLSIWYRLH